MISSVDSLSSKNRKILDAILTQPTLASIRFKDIELLIVALGGSVLERQGSRVKFKINGYEMHCHRPHPGKEAKRYQVEMIRVFLLNAGVSP
jgi:HicA toxin of bacterial toxin-antitoxin,